MPGGGRGSREDLNQHLGRDVEARVVVLALRAPLERPGLRRLVQQAQSDARVLSSCQAFEPWNGTTRISLLGREQEVAVHRVPCLLRGGTIGIRPETRCRKPSSHLGHGLLPCPRTATSRDGRHRAKSIVSYALLAISTCLEAHLAVN